MPLPVPAASIAAWAPAGVLTLAVLVPLLLARRAVVVGRSDRLAGRLGTVGPSKQAWFTGRVTRALGRWRSPPAWTSVALGATLGWSGLQLAGVGGFVMGAAVGAAVPLVARARRDRRRSDELERQVADVADSVALAVRSGLSIRQAFEFAATEVEQPMRAAIEALLRATALGTPLDRALGRWARGTGTAEAKLLVLILGLHARSGGDLAAALEEVSRAIRHRISVRRELRAMSAQGRISGAILGSLPIGFFLVLAATSRSELAPVYRSAAGTAMVVGGLLLELLAYLWIRRLLRVEV